MDWSFIPFLSLAWPTIIIYVRGEMYVFNCLDKEMFGAVYFCTAPNISLYNAFMHNREKEKNFCIVFFYFIYLSFSPLRLFFFFPFENSLPPSPQQIKRGKKNMVIHNFNAIYLFTGWFFENVSEFVLFFRYQLT